MLLGDITLVKSRNAAYFVKVDLDPIYTERQIVQMLDFLIDYIYLLNMEHIFQQTVGIPMGSNCAPLLADLFPSYEAKFIQNVSKSGNKNLQNSST